MSDKIRASSPLPTRYMLKRSYTQYTRMNYHSVGGVQCEPFNIVVEVIDVEKSEDMVYTSAAGEATFQQTSLRCLLRKYSFYNPFFEKGDQNYFATKKNSGYNLCSGLNAIAQCREYQPYDTQDNKEYEEIVVKLSIRQEKGDEKIDIEPGYWELHTFDLKFHQNSFSMQCHGMTRVEGYRVHWRQVDVGSRRVFIVRSEEMGSILRSAAIAAGGGNTIKLPMWQTTKFEGVDSRHIVPVPPYGENDKEAFFEMSPFAKTMRRFFMCAAAVRVDFVQRRGTIWDYIPDYHSPHQFVSSELGTAFQVSIFEKLAAKWKISNKIKSPADCKSMACHVIKEGSLYEKVYRAFIKNRFNKSHTINVTPDDMPAFFGMRSIVEIVSPAMYGMSWEEIEEERHCDISAMLEDAALKSIKNRGSIGPVQLQKIPCGLLNPGTFVTVDGAFFAPCNQTILYLEPKDAELFRERGVVEISANTADLLQTNKLYNKTRFNYENCPYFLRSFCADGEILRFVKSAYEKHLDIMLARSDRNKFSRREMIPDDIGLPTDLEDVAESDFNF